MEAYEQVDDGGSSICKVVVNVEGENANDPEFVNCPNGLTTMDVDEGSELGTSIDTVRISTTFTVFTKENIIFSSFNNKYCNRDLDLI